MPKKVVIPPFLKHLKVHDKTGYPIPFFVAYRDGIPDFRLLDQQKQLYCVDQKLCAICGKKLIKDAYYFISGPMGFANKISTDPAMHQECAIYSLETCPHLHFEKAQRRETGIEDLHKEGQADLHILDKPNVMIMAKARHFDKFPNPAQRGAWLIRYKPVSFDAWVYENGILIQKVVNKKL